MLAPQQIAMGMPEDQLLARCRAGDREALTRVYEQYERPIFRVAYHILGDAEDAHDVRQETFVSAFQSIGKFRGDASLQTWLLRICTNLCRKQLRSRDRHKNLLMGVHADYDGLAPASQTTDPAAALDRSETLAAILCALRSLPEAQREIIVLREIEQLSYEEIAAVIGRSVQSVKVTLFRARKRFAERAESLLRSEV
jgi:RNA polymerase sigma-70 factor, ECF subfamily